MPLIYNSPSFQQALLHDHPMETIDYWCYDFYDPSLFAYCVQAKEAGFYEVFCFKTTSKKQTGKRLNYAFDEASLLWGPLGCKQRREELRLKAFLLLQEEERRQREEEDRKKEEEVAEQREEVEREEREMKILRVVSWNMNGPDRRGKVEMYGTSPQSWVSQCTLCMF